MKSSSNLMYIIEERPGVKEAASRRGSVDRIICIRVCENICQCESPNPKDDT